MIRQHGAMVAKVWTYKVYPSGWAIGYVPLRATNRQLIKSLDVLWWTEDNWAILREQNR